MQADPRLALIVALAALAACTSPAPAPVPPTTVVAIPVAMMRAPVPEPSVPAPAVPAIDPSTAVLAFYDRAATLSPQQLQQEIDRLGQPDSAPQALLLAIALAQTRVPANTARAQALAQGVAAQAGPQSQGLQAVARLLAGQLGQAAEVRRLEEQLDRQNQQLRDGQRRIDQLNERLAAMRAIERSMSPAPAPANGARP